MKERFAGVYISHTRHERLIEQFDFDRLRRPPQGTGEIFHGEFVTQWFRTQRFLRRGVEGEPAKVSCVFKDEIFAAKVEGDRGVSGQWRVCGLEEHAPGHAKMTEQEKRPAGIGSPQSERQILPAAGQAREARTGQRLLQLRRPSRPKDSIATNFDPANQFAFQTRRKETHEDFDFGQLRHWQTLTVAVGWRKRERVGQVPDLADRAVAQQHFDNVEAHFHAGLFEQSKVIERGLR